MTSLALACKLGTAAAISQLPTRVKRILRKYPSMLHIAGPAVPILGPELVSNGAFDTADGWSAATGWGIAAGALNHTAASTLMPALAVATQAGKTYQCAYSITSQSAAGSGVSLRLGSTNLTIRNAVGTYSETLAQTVDSTIVGFIARGGSGDWLGSIDNLSVREIVGYQNTYASFAAGNYKESTGNTLAGIDQQVGLVVDAAQALGPELVSNGGFDTVDGWTLGSGWNAADGLCVGNTSAYAFIGYSLALGTKTYVIEFDITSYTSGLVQLQLAGGTAVSGMQHSSTGKKRQVITAIGNTAIRLQAGPAGFVGSIDNVSVRELPGTHAAQATSGYQPYLRQVPKTLGPELVVGAWGTATGVSVAGSGTDASIAFSNAGTGAASANLGAENVMQAGRKYRLTYTITNYSSGQFQFQSGGGGYASALRSANGTYSEEISPTAAATLVAKAQVSGSTFTVSNISIREVLEWTYAWQFDGTDDRFPLVSLPLASGDDFYQAFALRCTTSGANKTFADLLTNPTTGTRLGCLRINGANALQVVHANDAGGVVTTAGRTVTDGQQLVVEALRVGASHTVFADGVVDIQTALAGNYTTTHATIGARGAGTSEPYLGHLYSSLVIKGNPSDGERATIRKFMAQLQGRSL